MNVYINELFDMVLFCNGLVRKLDKFIVFRMVVNYMKFFRGSGMLIIKLFFKFSLWFFSVWVV